MTKLTHLSGRLYRTENLNGESTCNRQNINEDNVLHNMMLMYMYDHHRVVTSTGEADTTTENGQGLYKANNICNGHRAHRNLAQTHQLIQ